MHAIGGIGDGGAALATVEVCEPTIGVWRQLPAMMTEPRVDPTAIELAADLSRDSPPLLVVMGGHNEEDGLSRTAELYNTADPQSAWFPRFLPGLDVVGDRICTAENTVFLMDRLVCCPPVAQCRAITYIRTHA